MMVSKIGESMISDAGISRSHDVIHSSRYGLLTADAFIGSVSQNFDVMRKACSLPDD